MALPPRAQHSKPSVIIITIITTITTITTIGDTIIITTIIAGKQRAAGA